ERGEQVSPLLLAQAVDGRIVGVPLGAAVPAIVVVAAVAVVFAVGLVVLLVVADEILEGEAVVARDEIDARIGLPPVPLIEVAGSRQSGGHLGGGAAVAFPEAAHVVAILAVPLGPAGREIADLVTTWPDVPRLGD